MTPATSAIAAGVSESRARSQSSLADGRDVRSGGRWTRAQAVKNGFIAGAIRAALAVADRTPPAALLGLGRALGRAAGWVLRADRRRAVERALACFPPREAERVAQLCFVRAGENLALSLLLRRPGVRASTFIEVAPASAKALEGALARGAGVIFVTAHLGPFEFVAARVREFVPAAAIVVRESYDPRLDRWVDSHRSARGLEVIHRGAPGAAVRIVRALRRGLPVGFLPDLGGRVPSLAVRFLGAEVEFPTGPQELARRLGAPVVLGTLVRGHPIRGAPRFELRIEELEAAPDRCPVEALTQRVASALGSAILLSPEDWLWMALPSRNTVRFREAGPPVGERLLTGSENG